MSDMTQAALAQVREALAAGPTPGPWAVDSGEALNVRAPHGGIVAQLHHLKGRHGLGGRLPDGEAVANARLMAACSPANIAAIIAHVEAQAAEIKRLRKLAMTTHLFEEAPCFLCGYNGPGYYQPEQHPCAALYHEAMEEQQ